MNLAFRYTKFTVFVLCTLLMPALTGCVKLRQTITLMPDGSGKIEMRYGVSEQIVQISKQSDEDPFKEVVPEVMRDKCKGVVAFTQPVRSERDGFSYLAYTAYFRDINRLRIDGLGEGEPAKYQYKREGTGATLTVTHGATLSMISNYEPTPEAERDAVRKAMAGLELSEHFVLPGTVEAIAGVDVQANTARLDLSLENLLQGTGPIESLKGMNSLTLKVAEVQDDEAAAQAFRQELDAAVADWEKMKAGAAE